MASKTKKFMVFVHKDGVRKAKQLYVPASVRNAEQASEWLLTHGWSAPSTDIHLSADGKFAHAGLAAGCPLCDKGTKVVEQPRDSVPADKDINSQSGLESKSVVTPKVDERSSVIPMPLAKENDQPSDYLGTAVMLNLRDSLDIPNKTPHITLFFGKNKGMTPLKDTKPYKLKVTGFKQLSGPAPGHVALLKPTKDLIELRNNMTNDGFQHTRDWLCHMTLEYTTEPLTAEIIKKYSKIVGKTLTFQNIVVRDVKNKTTRGVEPNGKQ